MYFQESPQEYKVKGLLYIPTERKKLKVYNQVTDKKGLNVLPLIQKNLMKFALQNHYLGETPQSYLIVGLWEKNQFNQFNVRLSSNQGVGIDAEREIRNNLIRMNQ